jgi:hypothetical protein
MVGVWVWALWKYTGSDNLPALGGIVLGIAADFIMRLVLGPSASFVWWWTIMDNSPAEEDDAEGPPAPPDRRGGR